MTTKLRAAEEMYGIHEKIDRVMGIVKAHLSRQGLIVLRNTSSEEDEIVTFNCNLCDKVGNCTLHRGSYITCHSFELPEWWEEVS